MDNKNSAIGSRWEDFEKQAFTDEEIKESDLRVKKHLNCLMRNLKSITYLTNHQKKVLLELMV